MLITFSGQSFATWTEYRSKHYTVIRDSEGKPLELSWYQAKNECRKQGFALFSPTRDMTDWVSSFLQTYIPYRHLSISIIQL